MQIVERRTYRGPNLYAHFPVIRRNLDLGELEAHPSATIPGFELQVLTGAEVTFGETRGSGADGQYFVVYEYEVEDARGVRLARPQETAD